ncbi:MAG TPA: hypothetical protein P5186_12735 [Candidatus Paceibacterota bacterium]|nr:hypothetical protein [Verrucomicrobiota bacterium]HRY48906.1 hypothetical protein [Candidatus Paceibacterota bacterium]HRZ99118.1 hypothetical protein [Candidatus Paceibacterota bacterium]
MPIPLSKDTEHALGRNGVLNENRSFLLDRRETVAHNWQEQGGLLDRILQLKPVSCWNDAWRQFLTIDLDLTPDQVVFARLMSRLSLHLSTDTADSGGLLLDRLSNRPLLPGRTVKGCARQMAFELLSPIENLPDKARFLADIAMVFGWSWRDWSLSPVPEVSPSSSADNITGSLLALLPQAERRDICSKAQEILWQNLYPNEAFSAQQCPQRLARAAGRACFLSAFAWDATQADLAIEIITPHHSRYYRGDPAYAQAPDTERAIPRLYPVITPGQVFAFAVPGKSRFHKLAREWLGRGLNHVGLGARKSSGYGWFETSEALQTHYREDFVRVQDLLRQAVQIQTDDESKTLLKTPSTSEQPSVHPAVPAPTQESLTLESTVNDSQFWGKLQNFRSLSLDEKSAIVELLQGSQIQFWEGIKQRGRRGGQWAQVEHAIRAFSLDRDLGKMP